MQQDASQAQEQNELLTNELQLQKEKLDQIQAECDGRGECMFVTDIRSFAAYIFPFEDIILASKLYFCINANMTFTWNLSKEVPLSLH